MNVETLTTFLGWCSICNISVLIFWFLMLVTSRDFVYKMHSCWFQITPESFDKIHYAGLGFFKLMIFFFNFIPYLVLKLM